MPIFPVALARTYGKGRTFWSNFGHAAETWDDPDIQKMYLEAIKWAMGLDASATHPGSGCHKQPDRSDLEWPRDA